MEVDEFEGEIEYERLTAAVTAHVAEDFIRERHAAQRLWDGTPRLTHAYAVSKLAEGYADLYYRDADFYQQTYCKLVCKLGGLLHESMEVGATFEDLVTISDEAVANTIASVTPDNRMPRPKRLKILANQIGLAKPPAQIIVLASLLHDSVRLEERFRKKTDPATIKTIRVWIEESREIFGVLGKIKESAFLVQPMATFRTGLIELDQLCRQRR